MFVCMDESLKNVCTVTLGITYTVYHILGRKQTTLVPRLTSDPANEFFG